MRTISFAVAIIAAVTACKDRSETPVRPHSAGLNATADDESITASTGLVKAPKVEEECRDVAAEVRSKLSSSAPGLAAGIHGGDALTAEDVDFIDLARQCKAGESCVSVQEQCNCDFAINAKQADKFVENIRGKLTCTNDPCCAWGGGRHLAACKGNRCVLVDAEGEAVNAALTGGPPPICPNRDEERERAKQKREVAGMTGVRGGRTLTPADVIVLTNSNGCVEGDSCVRVEDACNCGFTVNAKHEAAVRDVAKQLKCDKAPCCRWKGKPVCREDKCVDTF